MWMHRKESGVVRFCVQPQGEARAVRLIGSFSGGRVVPMHRLADGRFFAEVCMPAGDNWCRIVVTHGSAEPVAARPISTIARGTHRLETVSSQSAGRISLGAGGAPSIAAGVLRPGRYRFGPGIAQF